MTFRHALTAIILIATVFYGLPMVYDHFGPEEITTTEEELAKCVLVEPIHQDGRPSYEMEFLTAKWHRRVKIVGTLAEEIAKADVLAKSRGFVRLSYKTLTRFDRTGGKRGEFYKVLSWKPK